MHFYESLFIYFYLKQIQIRMSMQFDKWGKIYRREFEGKNLVEMPTVPHQLVDRQT